MRSNSPLLPIRRFGFALLAVALLLVGCGEQEEPQDPDDFYDDGEQVSVEEPIEFTDERRGAKLPRPERFRLVRLRPR